MPRKVMFLVMLFLATATFAVAQPVVNSVQGGAQSTTANSSYAQQNEKLIEAQKTIQAVNPATKCCLSAEAFLAMTPAKQQEYLNQLRQEFDEMDAPALVTPTASAPPATVDDGTSLALAASRDPNESLSDRNLDRAEVGFGRIMHFIDHHLIPSFHYKNGVGRCSVSGVGTGSGTAVWMDGGNGRGWYCQGVVIPK
jgi:hypothetical protein